MGGVQIRTKNLFAEESTVTLKIFMPYDDIKDYETQVPLKVAGKVCWQKEINGDELYGIEFTDLDEKTLDNIKICIDYFNNFTSTPEQNTL